MFKFIKKVLTLSSATMWVWIVGPLITAIIAYFVIDPLSGFISKNVTNPLKHYWYGRDIYYVYLVGDFSDRHLIDLRQEFENSQNRGWEILKLGDGDVHIISFDAKEKEAERLSASLAKKDDTILVIGHLNSTASAKALPNYLNADPPIPVILATERSRTYTFRLQNQLSTNILSLSFK